MRKIILITVCIIFFNASYSINPGESKSYLLLNTTNNTELKLSNNYQQFKYQVINFETENYTDYSHLAKKRRRKKQDNLMLYVAGGLAVATATLILTSDSDNFTTNSSSSVNLGIAAGGTVACGLIVTKYFIDKRR